MTRSRILIADDHRLMAELCMRLLASEFDVVGTVDNGRALVQAASELKPDAIVLDISMPILNGLDAGQQVKQMLPRIRLVFLTVAAEPEIAAEAFRRGGSAYLLKTCASTELITAVRDVLRGKTYISQQISRDTVDFLRRQGKALIEEQERLTDRQREVLQLLAEGKAMKEVGSILNLTTRTVAFHKYRIMEMLGIKSNADLVKYAVRNHMTAAGPLSVSPMANVSTAPPGLLKKMSLRSLPPNMFVGNVAARL